MNSYYTLSKDITLIELDRLIGKQFINLRDKSKVSTVILIANIKPIKDELPLLVIYQDNKGVIQARNLYEFLKRNLVKEL